MLRLTTRKGPSKEFLHFLPALAQVAHVVGFYMLDGSKQAFLDDGRGRDLIRTILDAAVVLSFASYSVAGLMLLGRYRAWLLVSRSDAELWALGWIRNLLIIVLLTLAGFVAIRAWTWAFGRPDVFDLYWFNLWIGGVAVYLGVEGRRYAERPFPNIDEATDGAGWLVAGAWIESFGTRPSARHQHVAPLEGYQPRAGPQLSRHDQRDART
jgi:hypothetical protein